MKKSIASTTTIKDMKGAEFLEKILLYINGVSVAADSTQHFINAISAEIPEECSTLEDCSEEVLRDNLQYIEAKLIKPLGNSIDGIKSVIECYNAYSGLELQSPDTFLDDDFELEDYVEDVDEFINWKLDGAEEEEELEDSWGYLYEDITDEKTVELHNRLKDVQRKAEILADLQDKVKAFEDIYSTPKCIGDCSICDDKDCNYREEGEDVEEFKGDSVDLFLNALKDFVNSAEHKAECKGEGKGKGKNKTCSGDCANCTSCSGK